MSTLAGPALPLVSVVIPCFNRIALTLRAVDSVLGQTYPDLQIIVVNDASTEDDSALAALLASTRHAEYIRLEKNSGPGAARNAGIRRASGQYIAFLDSDDTWEKDKLRIQVGRMVANGWAFSHTSYRRHDTRTGHSKVVRSGSRNYTFPLTAFHCGVATPCVVLSRSLLGEALFRTDVRFSEDIFLWLALSKRVTLHGIDEPLTNVYIGASTSALDGSKQEQALRMLGEEGLGGRRVLQAVHAVYRFARRVQRGVAARLHPDRAGGA